MNTLKKRCTFEGINQKPQTIFLSSYMEIRHYNECEQFALTHKGLATYKSFEEAGFRVFERYEFNPMAIFAAVGKGGIIMPIISRKFFSNNEDELVYTVIITVNRATHMIALYNPITDQVEEYGLEGFIDQWIADGGDCVNAFKIDEKTYRPPRIDLSNTCLPDDLTALREVLAKHAHDVWATERQSEGWTYGPKRDDHRLETPDMLPYDSLPESEKDYDRKMATNTIKFLIDMGYRIERQ